MCLIAFNWQNHPVYKMVLDKPWPKVQQAKRDLSIFLNENQTPEIGSLVGLLQSTRTATKETLPVTGPNSILEKSVSAQFIAVDDYYGTVNTTAVLWKHSGEVLIREVVFIPDKGEISVKFLVKSS